MAGLFLVSDRDPDFAARALAEARVQLAANGFTGLEEKALPGWHLLRAPYIIGGPETFHAEGEDFALAAGTLTYDGLMGRPALVRLLATITLPSPDWSRLGGHFVLLVRRSGRIFLLTDYFAAFQLFHDEDRRIFSTSLLAAVHALPRLHFDPQGVYELAFNVVPIGNDTVFAELKTLDPRQVIELESGAAMVHPVEKPLPEEVVRIPEADRLEIHRDRLLANTKAHVEQAGNRLFCPLSGGIDSRLLLAALRSQGCAPNVYVYGGAAGSDVTIARMIGKSLGFDVTWFDKENFRSVSPDEFPAVVERNHGLFDGLPNFGELFDNGGNAEARNARHEGGAMSASGGCGEIFRNFFYLPDRRFSAAAVARTFFARFTNSDATSRFDETGFLRRIEDKIATAVGRPGDRGRLPRAIVEQVYPRIRCRSLFGREIGLESRFGAYFMPFLDHRLVAEAIALPLNQKNAGRFEARLLHAIDPELAGLPSAYGHDFAGPPGLRHRFGEWSTRIRPIALRQRSYALRRRLGPVADEHGGFLTPDYIGRVVDLDFPLMRQYFEVDRIGDSGLMRRIANLEYLASRLGSRLAG